ncbi:MAG: hypothetical protein UT34_C0001G0295 [candidate division WS6 bacterium GW2011_GWF2_39_15]|uniref:Uncharacterized protein n=1 Tax=candidate division WS6 bacterium GW2011_GWF2_39_15 TaxID=1619100 RepID=A0A0G0Q755_9BACT|nr:MAG: hypothetical protein UT34_C0001G0295 [candidate division WS6 bacterium GW2011_GWF2_39_15]
MIGEITEKLNRFLVRNEVFQTEPDVVYFCVEARKLLSRLSEVDRNKFALLKFYCDWALHTEKTQQLDVIEDILIEMETDVTEAGLKFVSMNYLKPNLSEFLDVVGLENFANKDDTWINFSYFLSRVLNEQPILTNTSTKSHVKSIRFKYGHKYKLIFLTVEIRDQKGTQWANFGDGKFIRLQETLGKH